MSLDWIAPPRTKQEFADSLVRPGAAYTFDELIDASRALVAHHQDDPAQRSTAGIRGDGGNLWTRKQADRVMADAFGGPMLTQLRGVWDAWKRGSPHPLDINLDAWVSVVILAAAGCTRDDWRLWTVPHPTLPGMALRVTLPTAGSWIQMWDKDSLTLCVQSGMDEDELIGTLVRGVLPEREGVETLAALRSGHRSA